MYHVLFNCSHQVLDILESKATQADADPIHSRLGKMADLSSSIAALAHDEHLSPNSKAGLAAALAIKKKKYCTEIIQILAQESKEAEKED